MCIYLKIDIRRNTIQIWEWKAYFDISKDNNQSESQNGLKGCTLDVIFWILISVEKNETEGSWFSWQLLWFRPCCTSFMLTFMFVCFVIELPASPSTTHFTYVCCYHTNYCVEHIKCHLKVEKLVLLGSIIYILIHCSMHMRINKPIHISTRNLIYIFLASPSSTSSLARFGAHCSNIFLTIILVKRSESSLGNYTN